MNTIVEKKIVGDGLDKMVDHHDDFNYIRWGLTIIIPCKGRIRLLERLLTSLSHARSRYGGPSEVLVIDSSSFDEAQLLKKICSCHSAKYFRGTENVREKRNLGIAYAVHEILLFIDSDVEADENLLVRHASHYCDLEIGGVLGVLEFNGTPPRFWGIIQGSRYVDCFSFAKRMPNAPWGPCANISYRTELVRKLGSFDTSFPFLLGGDDVDLGLRVNDAGYQIRCDSLAVAYHSRETWGTLRLVARRGFRWGRMHAHLCWKHPAKTCLEWPRPELVFVIMAVLMALKGLTSSRWVPFLSTSIMPMTYWCISASMNKKGASSDHCFFTRVMIAVVDSVFEFGLIYESILRRRPSAAFQKICYSPYQLMCERDYKVKGIYALVMGVLFFTFFF